MYRILITGLGAGIVYGPEDLARLSRLGDVRVCQEMTREELLEAVADVDVLMTDCTRIDAEVFHRAKDLELIVEHGVGYDNIDVACATAHGVLVCHTPEVYTVQVAEMAVAALFAASKFLCQAVSDVKGAARWNSAPFPSRHVSGKTLGIIGCGRIGSAFLRMMAGFHMHILVCDPYLPESRIRELGAEPVTLEALLERSDIISIHTPKTPETFHMLDARAFGRMKKGAILINTARGGIVDEAALAAALEDGTVLAAALDVMEGEPHIAGSPVLGHPRVLLTPHMAWKSEFSVPAVIDQCIKDVCAYAEGKPVFVCNPELLEQEEGHGK